jgi:DNA-directed RNA polymerase specialized sigma24 family protein
MRDPIDFFHVRPAHMDIHNRLLNWAMWCKGGGRRSQVLSMFREYRHGYEEPHPGSSVDTLDGHAVEKLVVALPEKHRTVLQWYYVRPYIPVTRVRKALGLTTSALLEMVHDARAMLRNRDGRG